MRQIITSQYRKIREFYRRYERWLMSSTLVGGFLIDYFTFTSIEIGFTFAILSLYWMLAGATIAFMHLYDSQKVSPRLKYARLFSPLVVQFTFGAMLSASLIFYWFSGAFSVSWPLIIAVAMLMILNDAFRHYFERPVVQLSVYCFATISLLALFLPFWLNSLDTWIFLAASFISAAFFAFYAALLMRLVAPLRERRTSIALSIAVIVALINGLYFAKILPPIPLALREAGLYHDIGRDNSHYTARGEPESFFKTMLFGHTLRLQAGKQAYLYTAVFAPANVRTPIVHHWQYYNPQRKTWVTMAKPSFTIAGGRKEGYKFFTWISNPQPGKWRIRVENHRGQVLGNIRFSVERTQEAAQLQEYIK